MTSVNRLIDYLEHMLEAAQQACVYVESLSKEDFLADRRTQQAVILNIVILGEAATKLIASFEPFLSRFPSVPWRNMRGMRNRVAHGYFDINLEVVWDTVQTALPALLAQLPEVRAAAALIDENENGKGSEHGA
jgi:uncharacterized protein with HEPN domain